MQFISKWCPLFLIIAVLSPIFGNPSKEEGEGVARRAAELSSVLSEKPSPLIPPISNRTAWEKFSSRPEYRELISDAEKLLQTPIPEAPEELYTEFHRNGNRDNYQAVWYEREKRLNVLALAELAENKGRFLPALEEIIRIWCEYPSWAHPAHDKELLVYRGIRQIPSLVSTRLAGNLCIIRQAMKEVLSPEISALIAQNVRYRILDPLREDVTHPQSRRLHWITCTNNWNPVCFCGELTAALSLCEPREERAWFLAAAEYFVSTYYFRGLQEDGYCSEGLAYWNYGFGHFAKIAELAFRATGGEINLYRCPKVRAVTFFPLKIEVAPGCYAALADCPTSAQPDLFLLALLSKRQGLGLNLSAPAENSPPLLSPTDLAVYLFQPEQEKDAVSPQEQVGDPAAEPFSYFSSAGVLVCRASKRETGQLAAVFKGGNNGELHNHNDLGSFSLLRDNDWLISDPGKEVYSARTFSNRRYDGELLSSYGHSVPRINGKLQTAGKNAKAEVMEMTADDDGAAFTLDLTSAYPESGATQVLRRFLYTRANGDTQNGISVTDTIQFAPGSAKEVEIPFITYQAWEKCEGSDVCFRIFPPDKNETGMTVRITAEDENGMPVTGTLTASSVGKDDPYVPIKPTRIAFTVKGAETGNSVTVKTAIVTP